jgi:electron transfer flavoprotein alpha subunit
MSVLVLAENHGGKFKKSAFEVVTYGSQLAAKLGVPCHALVLGPCADAGVLGTYGASRVLHVADASLQSFDSQQYTAAVSQIAGQTEATVVVLSSSANGRSLLGRLSVKLNAGAVSNANAVPDTSNGFVVARGVFSGKAVANYSISSAVKVISVAGNSLPPVVTGAPVSAEAVSVSLPAARVKVISVSTVEGTVPLPEAERVVSGGRGLKGPENWGILEELATELNATTACSRPVADAHWRPHHEHVGQTGVAIRPNLYIAIGISGAIQHLAGVNNSRTIVVINKDADAPFFKAADYGVVGDLFEILPRLTTAIKKFKAG